MPEQVLSAGTPSQLDFPVVLRRVFADVLEIMFFEEAVDTSCEHGWIASARSVRLAFDGSHCGEFLLSVAPEVAQSIAPAFLGIESEETTDEQCAQVLRELANILCGSVLSQLWPDADLSLAVPEPIRFEESTADALHACFLLPQGKLSVSIRVLNRNSGV
jgi:CheY-specific phosphatase CheX